MDLHLAFPVNPHLGIDAGAGLFFPGGFGRTRGAGLVVWGYVQLAAAF